MIKINENYGFENDSVCMTLYQMKIVKSGKEEGCERWRAIAFFNVGRFDDLLNCLSENCVADLDSLDEIVMAYEKLRKDILDLCLELKITRVRRGLDDEKTKHVEFSAPEERIVRIGSQQVPIIYTDEEIIGVKEWRKIELSVLRRDGWKCRRCDDKTITKNRLSVHHIKPRKSGGKSEERNLITLCKECHDFIELKEITNWDELTKVA